MRPELSNPAAHHFAVLPAWLSQVDPAEPLARLRGYLTEAGRDPSGFGVTWWLVAGPGGPESWVETVR